MTHIYFQGSISMSDVDVAKALYCALKGAKSFPTITGIIKNEISSNLSSVWPSSAVVVTATQTAPDPSSEPPHRG